MKKPIELYQELTPFLEQVGSTFKLQLTGGVYLRFANSGQRGETKWFNLGLAEVLITLRDIAMNSVAFAAANLYDETTWRDLGSKHFTDEAARSFITVQTKPVFTILAKIIHWAKGGTIASYSDNQIDLSAKSLDVTIETVQAMVEDLAPEALTAQLVCPQELPPQPVGSDFGDFRDEFGAAILRVNFL